MIRKKKRYSRPRKPYEASRIKEENVLVQKYALKNKREIWRTLAKVNYFRKRAMALAKSSPEEQEVLFNKLRALGLNIKVTGDVLALKVEDLLNRRLPTVVYNKKLATTSKQARQMVVHKKITIDGRVVNSPSYLVPVTEEKSIALKVKANKPKVEIKPETEEKKELNTQEVAVA